MADLKISQLTELAAQDLASDDVLAVVNLGTGETRKIKATSLINRSVAFISGSTISGSSVNFNSVTISGSSIASGTITTGNIADNAITGALLADNSSAVVSGALPASGQFTGQFAITSGDDFVYAWDGSAWAAVKAAGSIASISGVASGIVNIAATTTSGSTAISGYLSATASGSQFLAGPIGAGGSVYYRGITAADLPVATTTEVGGVIVNGNGLVLSGSTVAINNTISTASGFLAFAANEFGLVTHTRAVTGADLPIAQSGITGAVQPGTGLDIDGAGTIGHSNAVASGTVNGFTFDTEGHITNAIPLVAADIPNLDASKITAGILDIARIATDSITGAKLADRATAQFGDTQPSAEYIGQLYFNSLTRDIYIWDGNVWQPIGISVGEIVFAGTYDASTNLVASVTSDGSAVGLVVGQTLPAAATANNRYYLVVSEAGTGTGNAPNVALSPPDIILSNGTAWTEVDVSQTFTSVTANQVNYTPTGNITATNVQAALDELDTEKLAISGGTLTGNLTLGNTVSGIFFEGATDNTFETLLRAIDPTQDNVISLPNITGTVITTGDTGTVTSTMITDGTIVDADISASAAIDGSKIQAATTTTSGVVVLTNSVSSTSVTTAATPSGVKTAYDLAAAALPASGGTMTGAIVFASGQTISGYAQLAAAQNFTAAQRGSVVSVAGSGTVTINLALGNNFAATLSGTTTFALPSGLTAGQSGALVLSQDGTGSRLVSFSGWKFPGGTAPTATTTASGVDVVVYYVESASRISARMVNDVK